MQDDCPPNSERSSTQVAECEVVKNVGSRSIRKPLEIRLNDEFSFSFFFFLSFRTLVEYRASYSTRSFNSGTTVHYMNRIYPRLYVR